MGDIGPEQRRYDVLPTRETGPRARIPEPQPIPVPAPEPVPEPDPVPSPDPLPQPPSVAAG
ncbi:MAG TPA: hypothetical protein VGN35_02580 [Jatrophihabitantaceae bacterium]|jgi:hypothetical protein|nr:hypothetical protein [Jatrophihabitantaceae bacterium]